MAYRLKPDETVTEGLRRIGRDQLDKAIDEIANSDLDEAGTIHQVRKRCKKVRALVRLVRPAFDGYDAANTWFRDAARTVSDLRDASTMVESVEDLLDQHDDNDRLKAVHAALEQRREAVYDQHDTDALIEGLCDAMEAGCGLVDSWRLEEDRFDAIGGGLKKTYKRAREAMQAAYAEPSIESFHEWRKRAKYHRYHLQILEVCWPAVLHPRREEAHRLTDYLGEEHDLAVLRCQLTSQPQHFGHLEELQGVLTLIDGRRTALQARAHPLGVRLFAEKPGRHRDNMRSCFQAWQAETYQQHLMEHTELFATPL